jgi:hypothetical protein
METQDVRVEIVSYDNEKKGLYNGPDFTLQAIPGD